MVALLGLLAVAGFQNREKIAEALGGRKAGAGGGVESCSAEYATLKHDIPIKEMAKQWNANYFLVS